ncbi:hypothetical protein AB0K09_31560, partial [Streptomyces sp. NPDC049577]
MTRRPTLRCALAGVAALAAALGGMAATGPAAHAETRATASTPLTPELEKIRAAESVKLYGDAAERPLGARKTSLVSLGDSEISGEGVGTYEPGTAGPTHWCHRSP